MATGSIVCRFEDHDPALFAIMLAYIEPVADHKIRRNRKTHVFHIVGFGTLSHQ